MSLNLVTTEPTRPAAPAAAAPITTLALAMTLRPQGRQRVWHSAVVTPQGQALAFHSLPELVQFLVRLSLQQPAPPTPH